jgi:hypothetical protein
MALQLHHVYVCTAPGAPEAADLLHAGLVEGSGNTHPGQGSANRRFFFESGFLELLWVHDEREAQSACTAPTRLWERWAGRAGVTNPFGLCFSSADAADSILPFPSWEYRPSYFSGGRCILFADNLSLSEPEVFFPNWPQGQSSPQTEPTSHPLGLCQMRSVSVGLPDLTSLSDSLRAIMEAGLVHVHHSDTHELVIEFTSQQAVQHWFPALGLSVVGRKRGE